MNCICGDDQSNWLTPRTTPKVLAIQQDIGKNWSPNSNIILKIIEIDLLNQRVGKN